MHNKPTPNDKTERYEDDAFYEIMPNTASSHYVYRDDTHESPEQPSPADNAKLTAIITLILVGIVVLTLALLFIRGLEVFKDIR